MRLLKFWTIILLAVLALGRAQPASAEAADQGLMAYAHPQRLVRLPDGRRLNLYCLGSGAPTVLMDGGLAESTLAWAKVQPAIARTTRVCAYDRAGVGFSDPGPFPRDARRIVADLEALVAAAPLRGRLILVGHSLSGQTLRLYASRHLDRVAGMVLLDPALDFVARRTADAPPQVAALIRDSRAKSDGCMQAIAAAKPQAEVFQACGGPPPRIPGYPEALNQALAHMYLDPVFARTGISEAESLNGANAEQIAAEQRRYGDLPLVVLTATKRGETSDPGLAAGLQAVWRSAHEEIAALSARGKVEEVAGADHGLQFSTPDAVISAVVATVAEARPREP